MTHFRRYADLWLYGVGGAVLVVAAALEPVWR